MSKLIIVSNRLPVTAEEDKDNIVFKPSIGGLATGMKNLHTDSETVWVGWSGLTEEELESHNHEAIIQTLRKAPVPLEIHCKITLQS